MITVDYFEMPDRCLELIDHVAKTGETVLIVRDGKPHAKMVPPDDAGKDAAQAA